MSNTIQFDYDTFYNYYNTKSNLIFKDNPPDIYYYPNIHDKIHKNEKLSNYFIKINQTYIYVTPH